MKKLLVIALLVAVIGITSVCIAVRTPRIPTKSILFIFAMEKEMESIERYYNEHKEMLPYNAEFVLSGIGRSKVVSTLVKQLSQNKYDLVVNVGTCGVKIKNEQKDYPLGSLIIPSKVYDGDYSFGNEVRQISFSTDDSEHSLPLVTVSKFGRYDSDMNQSYIEDMEGFEIANVCNVFNQPFKLIKIVSDHITDNPAKDEAEFYENYEKVINLNTENVFNKVNTFIM